MSRLWRLGTPAGRAIFQCWWALRNKRQQKPRRPIRCLGIRRAASATSITPDVICGHLRQVMPLSCIVSTWQRAAFCESLMVLHMISTTSSLCFFWPVLLACIGACPLLFLVVRLPVGLLICLLTCDDLEGCLLAAVRVVRLWLVPLGKEYGE